jgi:hypothetical protein
MSPAVAILGERIARSGALAGNGPATDKAWPAVPGGPGAGLNGSPRRMR